MLWNQTVSRFKNRRDWWKKRVINWAERPIFWEQLITSAILLIIAYSYLETIVDWFFETAEDRRNLILVIAGLIGGYFLLRRTRALERNAKTAEQNAVIAEQGLTVDRLTRATEQLTNKKTAIRLSGILGLEQIALSHEGERKKVIRILSAFVRDIAPLGCTRKEEERHNYVDIEAAVDALANISAPLEDEKCLFCDLQETNLSGLRFFNTNLSFFSFAGANISNTFFFNVNFEGTELSGVNISNTTFEDIMGEPWESREKSFYRKGQAPNTLPYGLEPEEKESEDDNA